MVADFGLVGSFRLCDSHWKLGCSNLAERVRYCLSSVVQVYIQIETLKIMDANH